jgi:CcmD family protein
MNSNNLWYLFAAYSIIWLVVFGYVFTLIRREKALRKEIAALKEGMKKT